MSNPPRHLVRRATAADAPAMGRVHTRSRLHFYSGILPDEALAREDETHQAQEWLDSIERGEGDHWAAVVGDEIVGVCFGYIPQDRDLPDHTGEIFVLFVDPDHVEDRHGRALLETAIEAFRTEGHTSAVLWCLEGNDRARGFYEHLGWTLDPSALPRQIGPYEEIREVRYRLDLGGGEAVRQIVGTG